MTKTTEQFIEDAIKVHSDKYDYSLVEYVNSKAKVKIVCREHGEFWQSPNHHSRGSGCPTCSKINRKVSKEKLNKTHPELSKEWHPIKNGNLFPQDVTFGTEKKVWWQCDKGHEWKAYIFNRSRGHGCPYCLGKKACEENSLSALNPLLAKEWHPTKNKDLTPSDVTIASGKLIWWKCAKNHEWQAKVYDRNNGDSCPYCSNHRACKDNCLNTLNPKLSKEWHPTKNGKLTPNDVVPGSNKSVWWICEKGHEWKTIIASRNKGSRCPYCANQKICIDNCLATTHPTIIKEWHPTKNGLKTPNNIISGGKKKIWWMCKNGHEWQATIGDRKVGSGCPYCSNKKVCKDNCLNTINPELSKEWHSTKNGHLTPNDVTISCGKKVWWICEKGHEWKSVVANRSAGIGCPFCSGRNVCQENCLSTINPEVSKEWHPTKNGNLTPADVVANTDRKAWWICEKGHEWKANIGNRNKGRGCPICKQSKGEKAIRKYLEELNIKYKHEHKFKDFNVKRSRFDFYTKYGLIEYNGGQHYFPVSFGSKSKTPKMMFKKVVERDFKKEEWCKNNGIDLLIIPYWDYNRIPEILDDWFNGKTPKISSPPKIVLKHQEFKNKIINECKQRMYNVK